MTAITPEMAGEMAWAMAAGRRLEEQEAELVANQQMAGFAHLGIGEEGAFVGAVAAMADGDALLPTHRSISGVIMKGVPLPAIAAEMLGRSTGTAGGRGGIPHIASKDKHVLGMSGTVGGQFPIALGYAYAQKFRPDPGAVVCCFGDGTFNRGTFHEAVNMMALWSLPVVLFCDNNQYATSVHFKSAHPLPSIAERVGTWGLESSTVDGNDAMAVHAAVADALARCRDGSGPILIEAMTYRWRGHYEGDPQVYRETAELDAWRARDPILVFGETVQAAGLLSAVEYQEHVSRGERDAVDAVRQALADPLPVPDDALDGVFVA